MFAHDKSDGTTGTAKAMVPKVLQLGGDSQSLFSGKGVSGQRAWGHKATDTELTYAPVSQAYGLRHKLQFNVMFDLLLCSNPQAWAECCLELTAVSGYRMFLGPFG